MIAILLSFIRQTAYPDKNVSDLRNGDVSKAAIITNADRALQTKLIPVTAKLPQYVAKSGDVHDYISLAKYNWPNPNTTDGLPYAYREPAVNYAGMSHYDLPKWKALLGNVSDLTWGFYFTGDERYAEKAISDLKL
jgi:hypothetical protein